MPSKRSLERAAAESAARAKRLESLGGTWGLFVGALTGSLYAAPRIDDWGWAWSLGITAVCTLGGVALGAVLVGWLIGSLAEGGLGDSGGGEADGD